MFFTPFRLAIILSFYIVHKVGSQALLDLNEGETCKREKNATWTCTRLSECKELGDFKETRPPICGFEGKEPVVCCPGKQKPSGQALVRCLKYKFSACLDRLSGNSDQSNSTKHPYMALIGYGRPNSKEWLCTGTLVSERHVLGSASCQTASGGLAKWVRFGVENSTGLSQPQDYNIENTIVHPEYKQSQPYHDLVIFKLKSEVRFDSFVKPACLNTEVEDTKRKALGIKWSRPTSGQTTNTFKSVDMAVIDGENCKTLMRNITSKKLVRGLDPENQICAKDNSPSQSTCINNTGSPFLVNTPEGCLKVLIGVGTLGRHCIVPGNPGIYTRILEYIPWIESIVWPSPKI